MAIFKSKEERKQVKEERQQKHFDNFIDNTNLESLSDNDKDLAFKVNENLEQSLRYRIRASEGEIAQLEMMSALVEQNWLMIKLLNEINQKLDK